MGGRFPSATAVLSPAPDLESTTAGRTCRGLGHNFIGTEHLLLGLLREHEGPASSVLASHRITYEPARDAIIEELRRGRGMTPPAPSA